MPSHYRGTQDEERALNTFVKLMRAADSVGNRTNSRLNREGLTPSQFGAMEALLHRGPLCQAEIAAKMLKTSGNVTMVVDNLEKRGLVRRERSTEDRRFVMVHLTDSGRDLIESIFPEHARGIAEEMSVLTHDEQRALQRLCRKLGLQEHDG